MHKQKKRLLLIILVGGIAVLGSYAWGLLAIPDSSQILWGGVPESIRPIYMAGMFLGAMGFFAYTYFILFRVNPDDTSIYDRLGYGVFNILYIGILVPSALWLPLTFLSVERASQVLFWLVRLDLVVVGFCSICLLFALLHLRPRQPEWAYRLAVAGCVFFCIQTALLDAIIWGRFFRI
jgi:hypothetical protein